VVVDLFTKWVKAEPFASIATQTNRYKIPLEECVEAKLHGESRMIQRCFDDNKR